MSYDLYFNRSAEVTLEEFKVFFANIPHCKAEGTQAVYQNEATGVYFLFELATAPEEDGPAYKVGFNLNYYRPHFFGLEAAPVLKAVVDGFGFEIHDPQNSGMGDGPFSEEGFLRGWNAGNVFGYRAILRTDPQPSEPHSRPTAELEAIWRWNFEKESVQQKLGESVFVPRIFWVILDGKLKSAAVWPDGIAELVPVVDLYFIEREQLAPRRFFTKKKDSCLAHRRDLEAVFGPFQLNGYSLPCHMFDQQLPSKKVKRFVEGLRTPAQKPNGIAMDQVLNRELVEEFSSK